MANEIRTDEYVYRYCNELHNAACVCVRDIRHCVRRTIISERTDDGDGDNHDDGGKETIRKIKESKLFCEVILSDRAQRLHTVI